MLLSKLMLMVNFLLLSLIASVGFVMIRTALGWNKTNPMTTTNPLTPFCETFFDDARADKSDLLGPLNEGWSVVKRLLQHERQSQTQARSPGAGGASSPSTRVGSS